MRTLYSLLSLLLCTALFAQDPTPVARPQPTTYQPSASATTISVKWFNYVVYLEQVLALRDAEIARLKSGATPPPSNPDQVLEQLKTINLNTAALASRFYGIQETVNSVKNDTATLINKGSGTGGGTTTVDLTPVTTSLSSLHTKTDTLNTKSDTLLTKATALAAKADNIETLVKNRAPTDIKITMPTPDDAKAGSTVTLTASADGYPAPTWVWKKNDVVMPGKTDAVLTLIGLTSNDTATYTAVATNVVGSAQASIRVNVVP